MTTNQHAGQTAVATQSDWECAALIRVREEICDPETGYCVGLEYHPEDLSDHEASEVVAAHVAPIRAQLDQAVGLLREARDEVVELGNYYAVYDKHRPDREGACIVLTERIDAFLVAHPRQGTTIDAEKGADNA